MPHRVSKITSQIDSRQHDVDFFPVVSAKRNTVRGRSIDPVRVKIANRSALVRKRAHRGNRMASRRLLDVWSYNPDVTELCRCLGEDCNSGAIDSIIIGNEYAH